MLVCVFICAILSLLQATSKFVLGIKVGALKGERSEDSDIFINSVHDYIESGAKVAQEPPIVRRFVETKTWKAALKAQDAMVQMGAKVSNPRQVLYYFISTSSMYHLIYIY